MRRFLMPALALLAVLSLGFSVGLYSGFKKNIVFESIVKSYRLMNPPEPVKGVQTVDLDMTDRTLLDSTLLPLHQREVLVSDAKGKPLPLLASAHEQGDASIILAEDGTLFRLKSHSCPGENCLKQVGRLTRTDGSKLDSIYDLLSVEVDGGREWYVSYGQMDATRYNKQFMVSHISLPAGEDALQPIDPPLFASRPLSLRSGHSARSGGGAMVYDAKTDDIIVTIGDYSLNGVSNTFDGSAPPPQSLDSDLGKIFRINRKTGESHVISIGHRNPQGLVLTPEGELISTEHGPKGGDEINIIKDGGNYGWPYTSLGAVYSTYTFPETPPSHEGRFGEFTPPIIAFLPSPGISALTYIADFHPAWDGDLMVTTLKARSLMRVRRWETGNYVEQIYIGDRMRDVDIVEGEMILTTDSGKIILLTPVENIELARTETGLIANADVLTNCSSCHNISNPNSTQDAPHLRNILGRHIASAGDFGHYSDALKGMSDLSWDRESLERFIRSPQDFAPGTAMPPVDLDDGQIAELLASLELLR